MVSLFLREQERYTCEQLCELFNCSKSRVVHILKRLREFGIVKAVKSIEQQTSYEKSSIN